MTEKKETPIVKCPVEGCKRTLAALRATTALDVWVGLCLDHGKRAVQVR